MLLLQPGDLAEIGTILVRRRLSLEAGDDGSFVLRCKCRTTKAYARTDRDLVCYRREECDPGQPQRTGSFAPASSMRAAAMNGAKAAAIALVALMTSQRQRLHVEISRAASRAS